MIEYKIYAQKWFFSYSLRKIFYVYIKNGKEALHTSSRSVNTEKEVMELLEKQPEFMKLMNGSDDF